MTSTYAARTYKGKPATGNAADIPGYDFREFIGTDLEISEVIWRPTKANTPHWIAVTSWFGAQIDISLWLEDIEFLGAALGIDIPQGKSTDLPDVTWIQIRTADTKNKRLKGISCVIDNGVTIYPQDISADILPDTTDAKNAMVRDHQTVKQEYVVPPLSRAEQKHRDNFKLIDSGYGQLMGITYAPTRNGKKRWIARVRFQQQVVNVTLWQEHVDFLQICDINVPDDLTRYIDYADDELQVGVSEYDRQYGYAAITVLMLDGRPFLDAIAWKMYHDEFDRHPDAAHWYEATS